MSQKVYVYEIVDESDMLMGKHKSFTKLSQEEAVVRWSLNNLRAEELD